jgi:4-hydroxy-tetrahydrodipicolinate synthase
MRSFEWKGVFPGLLTPFRADDHLDLPLFEKILGAQFAAGVEGIILGGTLGEGSVLTTEEKEQLVNQTHASGIIRRDFTNKII